MRIAAFAFAAAAALSGPAWGPASAQTANPFGSFKHDATQPIEITADSLEVDQGASTATFQGKVVAGQGNLRLTAEKVVVSYDGEGGETGAIKRLRAEGDVFLTSGAETAKGEWAEYDVAGGAVTMGGGVVLTQGENAISGASLQIDLNAGRGRIEGDGGRVKTIFKPGAQGG